MSKNELLHFNLRGFLYSLEIKEKELSTLIEKIRLVDLDYEERVVDKYYNKLIQKADNLAKIIDEMTDYLWSTFGTCIKL